MKLTINVLILLMLSCLVAGGLWYHQSDRDLNSNIALVQSEIADIEKQAAFYGALGVVETTLAGYPKQFKIEWFELGQPVNLLLTQNRPWIDFADEFDESIHPPDPIAFSSKQAAFWYNPNLGIVRARVPGQITEAESLSLYNQVNNSAMTALPKYQPIANIHEDDRTEQPQPEPAKTEASQMIVSQPAKISSPQQSADTAADMQTTEQIPEDQPLPQPVNLMKPGQRASAE